jgi:hypothetical protein
MIIGLVDESDGRQRKVQDRDMMAFTWLLKRPMRQRIRVKLVGP